MGEVEVRAEAPPVMAAPVAPLPLWAGVLGGPLAWAANHEALFLLVRQACGYGDAWLLHLVAAVFAAVALGGAALSWSHWSRAGREPPGPAGDAAARTRFLAVVGLLLGAGFFLVIVAQWIFVAVLDPCVLAG